MFKQKEEESPLNKNTCNSNKTPKAYGSIPTTGEYPKQLLSPPPSTNPLRAAWNWLGSVINQEYSEIDSAPKNK